MGTSGPPVGKHKPHTLLPISPKTKMDKNQRENGENVCFPRHASLKINLYSPDTNTCKPPFFHQGEVSRVWLTLWRTTEICVRECYHSCSAKQRQSSCPEELATYVVTEEFRGIQEKGLVIKYLRILTFPIGLYGGTALHRNILVHILPSI